jgi:drug/metabolite transporter (DMT)-like permease
VRLAPLLGLVVVVLSISTGQLLFKSAAERANLAQSLLAPSVLVVLCAAIALYGGATLVWISVLRHVQLTVAYAFVSLSFVIVPILAAVFLHEPLTVRFAIGTLLITSGIVVSLIGKLS